VGCPHASAGAHPRLAGFRGLTSIRPVHQPATYLVFRCAVDKVRSHSPRRVVIRTGTRFRAQPDGFGDHLPPSGYPPMKL